MASSTEVVATDGDLEFVIRSFITRDDVRAEIESHRQPADGWAVRRFVADWALVVSAWLTVITGGWLWAPVAVTVIGSRQRALGNLLHDAAHGNLWRARHPRRVEWVLAAPLFEQFRRYRGVHVAHHRYLGIPEKDPDRLVIPTAPYIGRGRAAGLRLYMRALRDGNLFLQSLLGGDGRVRVTGHVRALVWWAAALGAAAALTTPQAALVFVVLWLLARATTYHAIRVLVELTDHFGLSSTSVLNYTRTAPTSPLRLLIHPHNDSYHLAHHLLPGVPLAHLPAVHKLLLGCPEYASAQHCDGYFLGCKSAFSSWVNSQGLRAPSE